MAKVVSIHESSVYGDIIGAFLGGLGHEVLNLRPPLAPDLIEGFGPDVIVLSLYRKDGAMGDPIEEPEVDLGGLSSYHEFLEKTRPDTRAPVVIVGVGLTPSDLPFGLDDMEFAAFSPDLEELSQDLNAAIQKRKVLPR